MGREPLSVPQYLAAHDESGHTHGSLLFDGGDYVIRAQPYVLDLAHRLFRGSRRENWPQPEIRVTRTLRIVPDLNWFLHRYPLRVEDKTFEEYRQRAIDHARRIDRNRHLAPTMPPPTFEGRLLPFQAEGVTFLVDNERALLADDMGLGKTVTALAALATANALPAIVVVPPNVQRQWRRMAGTFLDLPAAPTLHQATLAPTDEPSSPEPRGDRLCHLVRGLKPYKLPRAPLYVVHYGLLRAWKDALLDVGAKALIFDEIQELRHTGTAKYSAASLLAESPRYVWGLSGTPIYGYGAEIWAVLNVVQYHWAGDEESFTREWCTGYGTKQVRNPDALGAYLQQEGLLLRRRKSDVAQQLPPKRRIVHVIDSDTAVYNDLVAEAARLASTYDTIKGWHEKGLATRQIETGIRQATGIAKAPYAAAFVRTLAEAGERVVVCAHHLGVHDILSQELAEYGPVRLTGQETAQQKQEALTAFRAGQTPVIQLALRSTAGLDGLQDAGTCIVFAELDWSPAVHAQAEDRLHRIGLDNRVESLLAYYLVSNEGFDETMQEALGLKIGQFVGIMGDKDDSPDDRLLAEQAVRQHMSKLIERLRARSPTPKEVAA